MDNVIKLNSHIIEQNKKAASSFLNFAVDELADGDIELLAEMVEDK